MHLSRLARLGTVAAAVLAAALAVPASANAQVPQCNTFTHRYFLGSGTAITLRVGFVDTALQVCTDAKGFVTSANASQTVGSTGPGTTAGFVIDAGPAVVTSQDGGRVVADFSGRLRTCLPGGHTTLCDRSHPYSIKAVKLAIGPSLNPAQPVWSHGPEGNGAVRYYENA